MNEDNHLPSMMPHQHAEEFPQMHWCMIHRDRWSISDHTDCCGQVVLLQNHHPMASLLWVEDHDEFVGLVLDRVIQAEDQVFGLMASNKILFSKSDQSISPLFASMN